MTALSEFAPAKINLTLDVSGRRPDGYHEIKSLVLFARNVGDVVSLRPAAKPVVTMRGPTASSIIGENLVDRALRLAAAMSPALSAYAAHVEKLLPVAAGIGGGSADAAAALRLLRRCAPDAAIDRDWMAIAQQLGADVPVCFGDAPALMSGIGERVSPVAVPERLHAVLVNPNVSATPNKTARVFEALGAAPLDGHEPASPAPTFGSAADVVGYAAARRNALEQAASSIMPAIVDVLRAIRQTPGCQLSRLSGAGPTCFGLYRSEAQALTAANSLAQVEPSWWVRSAELQ